MFWAVLKDNNVKVKPAVATFRGKWATFSLTSGHPEPIWLSVMYT